LSSTGICLTIQELNSTLLIKNNGEVMLYKIFYKNRFENFQEFKNFNAFVDWYSETLKNINTLCFI